MHAKGRVWAIRENLMPRKFPVLQYVTQPHFEECELDDSEGMCEECFNKELLPLCLENIDIMKEWHLGVPLTCQTLFKTFIKKVSLRKSQDQIIYNIAT